VHLREDRRHIQDADVFALAKTLSVPLHLEMAATDEMLAIARDVKPATAMLVPEGRLEVTTEGGLDVAAQQRRLTEFVSSLQEDGIPASAFIDAQPHQIEAAAACGFSICEVHTGPWAHAFHDGPNSQTTAAALRAVVKAGEQIQSLGMQFNAGHALSFDNVKSIAAINGLHELHIGHAIISRAVFSGLETAVRDMVHLARTNSS
jgi:pyridoxine 5-phosphate synthase